MEEYFVEEKTMYDRILDFLVFLSVFMVTIFLILEIFQIVDGLTQVYLWFSGVVLVIFSLDLIRIKQRHDTWKEFFHDAWLDILATIPFELIALAFANIDPRTASQLAILKWFRVTRLSRTGQLQKVTRTSKVTRQFKAAAHMKDETENYKEKNRV
ncbi:MAG: ion transporter [Candidatus Woesearchaeota archaeon]